MTFSRDPNQFEIWNSLVDGVVITDASQEQNPIIYVNSAFTKISGFNKEEVIGKNCRFLNHGLPNPQLETIRNAVNNFTPCKVVLKNRKKNGDLFWNELSLSPVKDENGNRKYFIGIQRDVTKEVELESEFKETSLLFSSVVTNIPGVVYQWVEQNGHGTFSYVSDKLWTYFGIQPQDFGKVPSLIHPDDRDRWRSSIEKANASGQDWFFEGRLLYPDNTVKWWQGLSRQVKNENGKVIYNGIMLDITERKNLEMALEVEQKRMQASAKMISLGEMSAGIAHEINNPLSVISGNAGLVLKALTKEPSDIRKALDGTEKIQKMAERIAKIVKSLRQFARDDQMDPMITYGLRSIIDETLDIVKNRVQKCSAEIRVNVTTDCQIWCRPVQLSQVLLNLIVNAIDAIETAEQKWVKIDLEVKNDLAYLRVIDSGPGVPPAIRDRIMNPFFTTKEVGKGTGLGLSLSKSIAEDHGGNLILESNTAHTTFLLELPLAE